MYKIFTLALVISMQWCAIGQTTSDTTLQNSPDSTQLVSPDTTTAQTFNIKNPSRNGEVYKLKAASDIPVIAVGMGWSLYAFTKIYSKDKSSEETILSLNKKDINSLDRRGASVFNPKASDHADMIFYGSMPLPVILMLDKEIRKDAFKVATLYLEAMSVTGLLYTGAVYFNDRYRPYAYNPDVPMARRMRGGAKNSFFAGHVALVGTSTFFIAKIWNDYHPQSKVRWLPFTLAGLATGTMGYLRYRGGEHFITDIGLGVIVGTLSGILVPHVHKNKDITDRRLSFTASYMADTPQFGIVYKLSK